MPSTVVHVGLAGLVGVALLADRFDTRAVLFVMAVTALVDLDTLLGIVVPGTHRAAFHNLWIVLLPALVLYWDWRRDQSVVRSRWGAYGYRISWVTLVAVLFAHVLLDAFYNGANLFWPVHDRFFDLSGKFLLTDQRGFVQTFVELESSKAGTTISESTARGTTADTHYSTGFDPSRGSDPEPEGVERIFPIASSGELFVVTLVGYLTVGYRVLESRWRRE
ncbi:metal-dependent hydrolase [Natronosalvus rutilus]|uniref:Metal-dependent hydrolase n=1 Tax=Natronosalvus rutilus TaxID=2953753 RepID=A0A9E7SSB8_9EURY|nr:metal-dependent hydrolase [Natronosalvus rutilus]UTF52329.1 metal-dependent hydrolase [Natronosalvus rutilus]